VHLDDAESPVGLKNLVSLEIRKAPTLDLTRKALKTAGEPSIPFLHRLEVRHNAKKTSATIIEQQELNE